MLAGEWDRDVKIRASPALALYIFSSLPLFPPPLLSLSHRDGGRSMKRMSDFTSALRNVITEKQQLKPSLNKR